MSNDKALIQYEAGQDAFALEQMTSTDQVVFKSKSSSAPFSGRDGYEPLIMPSGLVNGGNITPAAADDTVSVSQLMVVLAGAVGADEKGQISTSGADLVCPRPTSLTHLIHSITVNNAGALAIVSGSEGGTFSETRGAAGGPALIPVDSVEIGQVRYSSDTSSPVVASEIKQVPGLHRELADFPVYTVQAIDGSITFASPLPATHVGGVSKAVYVVGFTPIFAEVPNGKDWVPSEISHSLTSTSVYGGAIGSSSSSLGQASFSAILKDGITDNILNVVDDTIWIKFYQNRNRLPHQLTQGKLGLSRTFPADGNVGANFTVSATSKTSDIKV